MDTTGVVLMLFTLISGTSAETCHAIDGDFTCLFGCCHDIVLDVEYVECCLSNGAGIGIIVGAIVFVLSLIGGCCKVWLRSGRTEN